METNIYKYLKLTTPVLKTLPKNTIFARGETIDSESGILIDNTGEPLRWIARRGQKDMNWSVYADAADKSWPVVEATGQRVIDKESIRRLIQASDEAMQQYRV